MASFTARAGSSFAAGVDGRASAISVGAAAMAAAAAAAVLRLTSSALRKALRVVRTLFSSVHMSGDVSCSQMEHLPDRRNWPGAGVSQGTRGDAIC